MPQRTEADTCREYVVPLLRAAGWSEERVTEQDAFTDGRITVVGDGGRRARGKRTDYLLRVSPDLPVAVVEAKREFRTPGAGLQQAKDYADLLELNFAYSTNGRGIIEFDRSTGLERSMGAFPTPDELWARLSGADGAIGSAGPALRTPSYPDPGRKPRYYQTLAINRALSAILGGQRRVLLTMATGTGKTLVAFQICWRLWSAGWNARGERRKPRILFLADRNVLVDDPKDKTFVPFGDARHKLGGGEAVKSREMYFSTYQSLAEDERRPGLYRDFAPDFFDLVVVDEAHRGSARSESAWREILEYFVPAYQLGMTATPLRAENQVTYRYFGNPVYSYSLRQGIDDGFLAPYRVHRVLTTYDAFGWRPSPDDIDRYGRAVPEGEYGTKDFERAVALTARTEAIARHLTEHLLRTDRWAKTIVFCVDQEHADEMRRAINNLNADLVREYPDYAARVTAEEGEIGRGHLARFQDVEGRTPVILTTSQLLTTGVDAPTVRNVAIARVVGSMVEFKQIIGRGTRVREDYGKLFFTILDYTGSATRLFADPEFDGDPVSVQEEVLGDQRPERPDRSADEGEPPSGGAVAEPAPPDYALPRKLYVDGGQVEIATQIVYELASDGSRLRMVSLTDYAADRVRTLWGSAEALRTRWADAEHRAEVEELLAERGIAAESLAATLGRPDADPLDLLCHLAFDAPLRTRRERADRVARERRDLFDAYGPEARQVLEALLAKYAEFGPREFTLPQALQVPPLSERGNPSEIARLFGGARRLREAVTRLQELLYAA